MPNNPDLVHTQQLIVVTINIPHTIDVPTFVDLVGELFWNLELELPVKSSKKLLQLATFSWQKGKTFKMLNKRFLKLKEDI